MRIVTILILFLSILTLESYSQNSKPNSFSKKGIVFEGSIDPKFISDARVSLGYKFANVKISASYGFCKEIDFKSYDVGFTYYYVNRRISLGAGTHAGLVNDIPGLGSFLEENIWITKRIGLGMQHKLISNGSLGQYFENRVFISIIL